MFQFILVTNNEQKDAQLRSDFIHLFGYEGFTEIHQIDDQTIYQYQDCIFATFDPRVVAEVVQFMGRSKVRLEYISFPESKETIYCVGKTEIFYNHDPHVAHEIASLIDEVFLIIGLRRNLQGAVYLKSAIEIAIKDPPAVLRGITTRLYPQIASEFDTSTSRVERSIRHALETCYENAKFPALNDLFKIKVFDQKDRPSNGEFIALIADKIKLKLNEYPYSTHYVKNFSA